jgi:hypothetical protein
MIDVDGTPVAFGYLERDGCWVAAAELPDRTVTAHSATAPVDGLALRSL